MHIKSDPIYKFGTPIYKFGTPIYKFGTPIYKFGKLSTKSQQLHAGDNVGCS